MYEVKHWRKFQHYHNRRPPWIKLYRDILDDFDYLTLPLASMALAPCIWLLASESEDGTIEDDLTRLAFRLHRSEDFIAEALRGLESAGFIMHKGEYASTMLAERQQRATPEREREGETEKDLRQASLPLDSPRPEKKPRKDGPEHQVLNAYIAGYTKRHKSHPCIAWSRDTNLAKQLLAGRTVEQACAIAHEFGQNPPTWNRDHGALEFRHLLNAASGLIARMADEGSL